MGRLGVGARFPDDVDNKKRADCYRKQSGVSLLADPKPVALRHRRLCSFLRSYQYAQRLLVPLECGSCF